MKARSALACAVAIFLGTACSDAPEIAGGTGTGTDNAVAARSLSLSLDSAMERAQGSSPTPVPLLLRFEDGAPLLDSVRADGADLRVFRADGQPLPFAVREWNRAARHASLWVRLGSFRRGSGERIVLRWGGSDTLSLSDPEKVWSGIPDSVRLARASLLVSDFESGTGEVSLPCRCNSFYSGQRDSGVLTSPTPHIKVDSAVRSAGAGRAGKALRVVYSASGESYALIGTRLGRGTNRFAGLDSVSLWMRGSGTVRVALENSTDTTSLSKAWIVLNPDTSWRRFAFRPADFKAPSASARGWQAIKDSVNTLSFFYYEGGEVWIDDVRFHGLAPSDIP